MKKIPTLFRRDPEDMRHVTTEVNQECQWVFDGEGVATRKYDGTCVMHSTADLPRPPWHTAVTKAPSRAAVRLWGADIATDPERRRCDQRGEPRHHPHVRGGWARGRTSGSDARPADGPVPGRRSRSAAEVPDGAEQATLLRVGGEDQWMGHPAQRGDLRWGS